MEQKYKRFEELNNWFEEEEKNIFEELIQDIQQLTQFPIKFNFGRIDKGWQGQIAKLRTEVVFIKKDGMESFGSDFTIEFDRNELIFNYGCVGHFGKESIYYIERTKLMAKLFDKWGELEAKYLEKLNNKTFSEYFSLLNEISIYEEQKRREERKKNFNKVLESIKPGQIYYVGNGDAFFYRITKITNARVYFEIWWRNNNGKVINSRTTYESHTQFVGAIQRQYYTLKED